MIARFPPIAGRGLRRGVVLGVVALLAVLLSRPLVGQPPAVRAQAQGTQSQTFDTCGTVAHFTVPAGVTELTITAQGGSGGSGPGSAGHSGGRAGRGGVVRATIPVTPGAPLSITPGCAGGDGASGGGGIVAEAPAPPACPGGDGAPGTGGKGYTTGAGGGSADGDSGANGGGGGGSSAVVAWTMPLLLVAGGGGGGGGAGLTGSGGDGGNGGQTGTSGHGGTGPGSGDPGAAEFERSGNGGEASGSNSFEDGGGGGGGGAGWPRGGGGGHGAGTGGGGGGGGAGGASFAISSATNVRYGTATSEGNGCVTLSWSPAAPTAAAMTVSGQVHHVIPPLVSEGQIEHSLTPHTSATVEALVGSTVCGTAVTDATGRFQMTVAAHPATPGCGRPGATVRFRVEGTEHPETVPFVSGGAAEVALRSSDAPLVPPRRWP